MLETFSAAMLDQGMNLAHAGASGDQHQRTVRQFGQVGIAKGQLDTHQRVALQLFDQAQRTGFARQHVNFQITPAVGCRSHREGGFLAALALDHQILPGVITRRLAGRCTQTHAPGVATDLATLDDLTRQAAHRQLTQCEYVIPQQHAVFQRCGDAGVELAMIVDFAGLLDAAVHQQRCTHMAIAVAAALRAVIAQAPRTVENPLTGLYLEHGSGRLQGYTHQSIPN